LAQRTAHALLEPPRPVLEILVEREHRSEGAAEPLREADLHRARVPRPMIRRYAALDRGIEQSRAVDVERQAALLTDACDSKKSLVGPDAAAAAIARVLDHHGAARGLVRVVDAQPAE
jgi:hypothetical protein